MTELVAGRRSITADTALRLARALDTTPEFWLNLQQTYELRRAENEIGPELKSIRRVHRAAVG